MTDRFRDFDAFEAEHKHAPLTFKLGGQEWQAANLGFVELVSLTRRMAVGGFDVTIGYSEFLAAILDDKDREPFQAMLAERHISSPTCFELGNWIIEQASKDPLGAASGSPPSRRRAGGKSRVVSLSRASTSGHSVSAAG